LEPEWPAEVAVFAVEVAEEVADLEQDLFAVAIPLLGGAKDLGGIAQTGEADVLGPGVAEVGELVAEVVEEGEFVAVSGLLREADQRKRDGRGERLELVGDAFTTDPDEHVAHPFEEIGEGKQAERALRFEILLDAEADLVDEGEVFAFGGLLLVLMNFSGPDAGMIDLPVSFFLKNLSEPQSQPLAGNKILAQFAEIRRPFQ
jgi:hypothetical protein